MPYFSSRKKAEQCIKECKAQNAIKGQNGQFSTEDRKAETDPGDSKKRGLHNIEIQAVNGENGQEYSAQEARNKPKQNGLWLKVDMDALTKRPERHEKCYNTRGE